MSSPDKVNGNVYYYDDTHSYIDKDTKEKFISVTTLIHKYTQEFDEDFWTSYKALEQLLDSDIFSIIKPKLLASKKFNKQLLRKHDINEAKFWVYKQNLIDEYEMKRNESCERGTRIHAELENQFYTSETHDKIKYYDSKGLFVCKKDYYDLDLEKGIYPEYLIHRTSADGTLRIAGQIDLLIKDGNDIIIVDYKTNKEIKEKSYYNKNKRGYECMKFPLNNVMDCNLMHYTLQLSLYAYLLKQINPEFNIKLLKIHHIDHNDKVKEYELPYMEKEVELMLKHFKKTSNIERQLQRNKRVC